MHQGVIPVRRLRLCLEGIKLLVDFLCRCDKRVVFKPVVLVIGHIAVADDLRAPVADCQLVLLLVREMAEELVDAVLKPVNAGAHAPCHIDEENEVYYSLRCHFGIPCVC